MRLPDKYKGSTPGPWTANEGQTGCWFIWDAKGGIQTENLIATFNGRINADYRDPFRAKADAFLVKDAPKLACRVAELEELLRKVLPYAESRAEDLTAFKEDGQEDPEHPGADEAWAAVREGYAALAANDNTPCGSDESTACAANDNAASGEEAA